MNKKNIKSRVATLLAASMVATVLAPAMPAYAADKAELLTTSMKVDDPNVGNGNVILDLTTKNPGMFPSDKNLLLKYQSIASSPPSVVEIFYKHETTHLDTDLTNNFFKLDGSRKKFPWVDGVSNDDDYSKLNQYIKGYKLVGWYELGVSESQSRDYIPSFKPSSSQRFYAKFEGDTTENYVLRYEYKHKDAGSGKTIPLAATEAVETIKNSHAGSKVSKTPKNLTGYKVSEVSVNAYKAPNVLTTPRNDPNTSGGAYTFPSQIPNPIATGMIDNFSYQVATNKIEGYTVPADVVVTVKYEEDPSIKQNITVIDRIWSGTTFTDNYRTLANPQREVSFALNTDTELRANSNYITPSVAGQEARYVVDSSKGIEVYANSDPKIGDPTQASTTPTASAAGKLGINQITKPTIPSTPSTNVADYQIGGNMVNYGVTIIYNYSPNPNYASTIRANYKDNYGNIITDEVLAALSSAGISIGDTPKVAAPYLGIYSVAGGSLEYKPGSTAADYNIPAPDLDGYMPASSADKPTINVNNAADYANAGYSTPVAEAISGINGFKISAPVNPSKMADTTIIYKVDPNRVKKLNLSWTAGGKIVVPATSTTPEHEYSVANNGDERNLIKKGTSYKVTQADLYEPRPDPGYSPNAVYQYKAVDGTWQDITSLPFDIPDTAAVGGRVSVRAKFESLPGSKNTYIFVAAAGDTNLNASGLNTSPIQIINVTAGGAKVLTIYDTEIDSISNASGVTAAAGYRVAWYDTAGREVSSTTDIIAMGDMTFTARAVPLSALNTYTPDAQGNLDADAKPSIEVSTSPAIDPRLNYVVTDEAGKILDIIPGDRLASNNGKISGNYLIPSYPYNLHTVDPSSTSGTGLAVGQTIPSGAPTAEISAPRGVVIPATVPKTTDTPNGSVKVKKDSTNTDMFEIEVSPTSPDTEYELIDALGNVVHPWTTPATPGAPVVFKNLSPNTTYKVVPRKAGTNDPGYPNNGTEVTTDRITPVNVPHKVTYNSAVAPASIKVGNSIVPASGLDSIMPGTTVQITASPIDTENYPFNSFSKFAYPSFINPTSGAPVSATPDIISFVMPNTNVTITALYLSAGVEVNAATPSSAYPSKPDGVLYDDPHGSNDSAVFPGFAANPPSGQYRLHVSKVNADSSQISEGATGESDPYTGEFVIKAVVEVYDSVLGKWVEYTGGVNPIPLWIDTGTVLDTNDYSFKDLSNTSINLAADVDFKSEHSAYPGFFNINVENDKEYIFGYTTPPIYTVRIKSNRVSSVNIVVRVKVGTKLRDYISRYQAEMTSEQALPVIDNDGYTWKYKGLSKSDMTYEPYDDNNPPTSDEVVYIYSENDKKERDKAAIDLGKLLADATSLAQSSGISESKKNMLNAKILEALAVLNKMNRKASTPELLAALEELQKAYNSAGGNNGGNGGNSGGGGSGGGGGSANVLNQKTAKAGTTKVYAVGTDGNWELINAAEHKWVFNLNSGTRLTGWNMLSYQYEGKTRTDWYFFGNDNIMRSGWFFDTTSNAWYYLSEKHDGFFGSMEKGWYYSSPDQYWYYLNPENGSMHTGWSYIGEHWYFLNDRNSETTWNFNDTDKMWEYKGNRNIKPLGAMYRNERTPDGYQVNADGVWNQ